MAFFEQSDFVKAETVRLLPLIGKNVMDQSTGDRNLILTGIAVYANEVHCCTEKNWGALHPAIIVTDSRRIIEHVETS